MAKQNFQGEKKYIIHLIKDKNLIETKPLSLEEVIERLEIEKENRFVKKIYVSEVIEIK
jgi:hypothetical protein